MMRQMVGNQVGLRILALAVALVGLAACSGPLPSVPPEEEAKLETDGVISRYHALLNTPYSQPLLQNGYIIGIEKAPRDGHLQARQEGYDTERFQLPSAMPATATAQDLALRQAHFERVNSDVKVMFVSHVLRYHADKDGQRIAPSLLHSAYTKTALLPAPPCAEVAAEETIYEKGWGALTCLERQILADAKTAKDAKAPYTHLVFLSMGWNNDQFESLERYNAIMSMTRRAARHADFNPLVIGITWPSVWGGTSVLDTANRALHLFSYPVKADDADEIGYGIANHVLNVMMPRIEAETGMKPVAIGHSMGARVLTRAYFSADVAKEAVARSGAKPLVISLQGAFSANRFRADHDLIWPFRYLFSAEGGPYQDQDGPGGQMVMTWSLNDTANPVARYVTGAAHVGGNPGNRVIENIDDEREDLGQPSFLEPLDWPEFEDVNDARKNGDIDKACKAVRADPNGRVLNINATKIVHAHSDIRNVAIGDLTWRMISCFQP